MSEAAETSASTSSASARKSDPDARAFVSDQYSEGIIRQSLNTLGLEKTQFTTGDVNTAVATFKKETSPELLIVDVSGVKDAITSMRQLAEVCEPDVNVIVIGDRNDIVLYRDLKNIGINEYFLKPIVRDLFTKTCHRILNPNEEQPRMRTGKLVLVLGVRGGVGTTTIATNTAWHLAEVQHRHSMLLDLDLHGGDTALQLDVTTNSALRDAFQHPERVDKLYLERGAKHLSERLDLLAALENLDTPLLPNEDGVMPLMEKLLLRYRFVVVDLPATAANLLPRLTHLPGICVLVSNSSLTAARDIARWRSYLGTDTPDRSTLHILNHITPHTSLSEENFVKGCGKAPDIVIPYDSKMPTASSFGIEAMQQCTTFNRSLSKMLNHLTGSEVKESRSLLNRMFG